MEIDDFEKIRSLTDEVSHKVVSCQGCTKCCEKGLVYVMPEEKESLLELGVPIINIDGIDFIKRRSDGSCWMLDKKNKKCSIYERRPFCCQVFPLDLFSRHGKKEWIMYTYCPSDRIKPITMNNGDPKIDFDKIGKIVLSLDNNIPEKVFSFLAKEDGVASEIELLDEYRDEYQVLNP